MFTKANIFSAVSHQRQRNTQLLMLRWLRISTDHHHQWGFCLLDRTTFGYNFKNHFWVCFDKFCHDELWQKVNELLMIINLIMMIISGDWMSRKVGEFLKFILILAASPRAACSTFHWNFIIIIIEIDIIVLMIILMIIPMIILMIVPIILMKILKSERGWDLHWRRDYSLGKGLIRVNLY